MNAHRKLLTIAAAASLLAAACGGSTQSAVSTAAPTTVAAVSTPTSSPAAATQPAAPTAASAASSTTTAATTPTTPTADASVAATPTLATGPSATTATAASGSGVAPTPTTATGAAASSASAGSVRYDVVASGSKVDYRVREQLVRLPAPSDAVGTTTAVTGDIVIASDGKIESSQSKLVVDLTSLQSDSGMRDRFIQGNTLDTAEYPTATFVPTAIEGLTAPLPSSGQHTFKLTGNLTIHGVTKPVTFDVSAQVDGSSVAGQATTDFKFEDFGMSPPQAGAVLSVNDDVKLEVTLHLARSA